MGPRILVTGAAGYIGSHTCLKFLQAGWQVTAIDDLSNASAESLRRVAELAGRSLDFVKGDVRDEAALARSFAFGRPEIIVHFAGLKAVGESFIRPLDYYSVNVQGTMRLIAAARAQGCFRFVFSSSATVYGIPEEMPITESARIAPQNPYGHTKSMAERILLDFAASDPRFSVALLRYFNPVGAHPSGRIGEDPAGVPANLLPFVAQVAVGRRPELLIFGNDWPTRDGTGVRDYIHVEDLADGHLAAVDHLMRGGGSLTVNLGTGAGVSVLEIVAEFEKASGRPIPRRFVARRDGDVAEVVADAGLALRLLGWKAKYDTQAMCEDLWRWQQMNPQGFR